MVRTLQAAFLALLLTACQNSQSDPAKTDTAREKTTAEKAFDAGQAARQKAEKIKAAEDKKAKEADEAANQ